MLESSSVNGPGIRAVIWTQGCSLACPGCWNPDTHAAGDGSERSTAELIEWLGGCAHLIDGVTLSGGEPIQQLREVSEFVNAIRVNYPRLTIGMFSGYSEQELESGRFSAYEGGSSSRLSNEWRRSSWLALRAQLDFAVLGRYNALAPAADPLVTSRNQRLRNFTGRYAPVDFADQGVEVSIDDAGLTQITGFPVRGEI